MRRNHPPSFNNERNIRLAVLVERRRHANDHRLHLFDPAEISRSGKFPSIHRLGDVRWGDVIDITLLIIQKLHLPGINIQAKDGYTRPSKLERQRQPHITETNNGYLHSVFIIFVSAFCFHVSISAFQFSDLAFCFLSFFSGGYCWYVLSGGVALRLPVSTRSGVVFGPLSA